MKKSLCTIILSAAAVLMAALPFAARPALADYEDVPALGRAWVSHVKGDTSFNSKDSEEWAALTNNFTLREGDRLWAGDKSRMEVRFSGGQTAWANYSTEIDVNSLKGERGADMFQLAVPSGEASFSVGRLGEGGSVFQVDTPNASVRAYDTAVFRIIAGTDGTTQVGVISGSVEVESSRGVTDLSEGDMLEVYTDGTSDLSSLPDKDSWDEWVDKRIAKYNRPHKSARYLPKGMDYYADEFDNNGRWVSYPDYGNVWVPTVATGWSPYSNGRWVWINGDYVWLGYDPWYAPFHYGRWAFTNSLGWYWVPPVTPVAYWSPGYVGWTWGPDRVYWVPLAPREVYYGYGYYGPNSVNIYHKRAANVTNVFINSRITNGVVAVHRDDFLGGRVRRSEMAERENPFIHRGINNTSLTAAAPVKEFKPIRATILPKPDIRPSGKALPPREVERMRPRMEERRVVTDRAGSAFRPGEKPRPMKVIENDKGRTSVPGKERGPTAPPVMERGQRERRQEQPRTETPRTTVPTEKERGRTPAPEKDRGQTAPPVREYRQTAPAKEREYLPPAEAAQQRTAPTTPILVPPPVRVKTQPTPAPTKEKVQPAPAPAKDKGQTAPAPTKEKGQTTQPKPAPEKREKAKDGKDQKEKAVEDQPQDEEKPVKKER